MEMEKMIELIDAVSKSDLTGFKYEEEGIKLHLSNSILRRVAKTVNRP